jgi:hypothetical protein
MNKITNKPVTAICNKCGEQIPISEYIQGYTITCNTCSEIDEYDSIMKLIKSNTP